MRDIRICHTINLKETCWYYYTITINQSGGHSQGLPAWINKPPCPWDTRNEFSINCTLKEMRKTDFLAGLRESDESKVSRHCQLCILGMPTVLETSTLNSGFSLDSSASCHWLGKKQKFQPKFQTGISKLGFKLELELGGLLKKSLRV